MDQVIHNRWRDIAFVDYGEKKQYTHGEVAQQVQRFHKLFRLLGIQPGDKIAIASRNCSNWVVSYMAIMSYKAVAVMPKCSSLDHTYGVNCSTKNYLNYK